MDWTALTAALDFSDATDFIAAAAVAVVGVLIVLRGIRLGKKAV